jgi:hypothetical protein
VQNHRTKYPDSRTYLVLDEEFFKRFPMSPARIHWFTQYATQLGAEIVRGDLKQLLTRFQGASLTIEECYQPSYREALSAIRSRPVLELVAFPHVHPQFGLRYFSRFF